MPQEQQDVHDFHDRGYRFLLTCLRLFQELIEGHVDQEWKADLDLDRAEKIDRSFVLESYLEKESDILYCVPMRDRFVYLYILVEHQSTVDFLMAFRLLIYVVEVWKYVFENTDKRVRERKDFRLPPVFPVVLYNGEAEWTASRDLRELIADGERFGAYVPDLRYWLVDASHCDRERLRELHNGLAGIFTLEHRPRSDEEAIGILDEALAFLNAEPDPMVWRTLVIWVKHWLTRSEIPEDEAVIAESLDPNAPGEGGVTMNTVLRDMLIRKWKREGKEEGLREFALRILRKRFEVVADDVGSRLESVHSFERLEELAEQAMTCESLEAFAKLLA